MLPIEDVVNTLKDPSKTFGNLTVSDISELNWFIRLEKREYKNAGYFASKESVAKLCFPDVDFFATNDNITDLHNLFNSFAWKGFMHYCQPGVDSLDSTLSEFLYRGKQHLDAETAGYMLRFPSSDWLDALLDLNSINPTEDVRQLIEQNKLVSSRSVCADFKHVQARLYALLYLLDHMAFIHRYYDASLNSQKELVTRSPELLRYFLGDAADNFIEAMYNVDLFDSPITGSVLVASIKLNRNAGAYCEPTCELTYIDTNDRFSRFLPLFEYFAYADGVTARINDMPNGAAELLLDFRKTGFTKRYATLSKGVLRGLYASTCLMSVNTRSRVDLGLDIFDEFGYKYWNLQSSVDAVRNYSAFNLFSLYNISACNLEELTAGILSADYDAIYAKYKSAIDAADDKKLAKIAILCGINPKRPRLKNALYDWGDRHHPSEVYKLCESNKDLFD